MGFNDDKSLTMNRSKIDVLNFSLSNVRWQFSVVSSSIAEKKSFSISSNLWISQEKFNLFFCFVLTCVPTSPWCLPITSMYLEVIIKQIRKNKYSHYYLLTWLLMLLRLNFIFLFFYCVIKVGNFLRFATLTSSVSWFMLNRCANWKKWKIEKEKLVMKEFVRVCFAVF